MIKPQSVLLLGIGNPIRIDDGIGILLGNEIGEMLINNPPISSSKKYFEILQCSDSGFSLLDYILGYDVIFIFDAIRTVDGKIGNYYIVEEKDLSFSNSVKSSHGVNIFTVLETSRKLKYDVADKLFMCFVEVFKDDEFGEGLSDELKIHYPHLKEQIYEKINSILNKLDEC